MNRRVKKIYRRVKNGGQNMNWRVKSKQEGQNVSRRGQKMNRKVKSK